MRALIRALSFVIPATAYLIASALKRAINFLHPVGILFAVSYTIFHPFP
jgi:hypothetical protein